MDSTTPIINPKDIRIWFRSFHPTTIVNDRYGGSYSGGRWLAFPLEHGEVPAAVDGCDRACVLFWDSYTGPVGRGSSPDEAFENLKSILSDLLNGNENG